MKVQNIIIWAWITWITIAQQLAEKNEEVLIIEKRSHIWWNCFDYYNEYWILVHKYWPHIFHTNYEDVRHYLNRFTKFNTYQHKVLWFVDWQLISIPFNIESLYKTFGIRLAEKIEDTLLQFVNYWQRISILELKQLAQKHNNKYLKILADFIFEKIFKNYTIKQWGIKPENIKHEVLKRVPILFSKDWRYFQDKYQWMPTNWYTAMFKKMLNYPNIKILLNTDYKEIIRYLEYKRLIYTWPIDYFFDYKYGKLDYKKHYINLKHLIKNYFNL